jgi:hypothetical protein
MKTLAGWNASDCGSLRGYLEIGDLVDDEMYYYFLGVVPPLVNTSEMLQVNEPCDHVNGRATYLTFVRKNDAWTFAGECWAHDTVHRPRPVRS